MFRQSLTLLSSTITKAPSSFLSSSTPSPSLHLLAPVWTHLTNIQPTRASGIYLYDDNTKERYMDFTSGIGVVNTGHCHSKIVHAIQKQAEQLIFGQVNIVVPPATIELAQHLQTALSTSSRWTGLNRFFFSNSGAEAVEASIKLARHATGKSNIIVFQGSFHGRTHQAMAMTTAKAIYRVNYQPLPGGIFVAPFPAQQYWHNDNHTWPLSTTNDTNHPIHNMDTAIDYCLEELQTSILKGQSRPDETAAMILEPVLGEGGYIPAPPRFLRELLRLCKEHDILFIADEVQSGMGRTGKLFSLEHAVQENSGNGHGSGGNDALDRMEPDILIMAKGLGSGVPISAIASRDDLMKNWIPGSHGGTYGGGSAIAAAAAVATLDVLLNEGVLENATIRGAQLMQELQALQQQQQHPSLICNSRGLGLMVGTQFPSKAIAQAVQKECLARNLLLLTCATKENVIRWIPPLIVSEREMEEALSIFADAVQAVVAASSSSSSLAAAAAAKTAAA
ncbi:hypothetical protein ACA910_005371 [Epithemia clementina (nom. ined.)]